jgi:ribose transport system substrate-binding protein
VWASGGDMTRGAVEAFKEAKRPLVPMFGEDSNGFLKLWKDNIGVGKFDAVGASMPTFFFGDALKLGLDIRDGKTVVGKDVQKDQVFPTMTITQAVMEKIVRPDLPDSFWANTHMDDAHIKALFPAG